MVKEYIIVWRLWDRLVLHNTKILGLWAVFLPICNSSCVYKRWAITIRAEQETIEWAAEENTSYGG